jgi:ferredoxin
VLLGLLLAGLVFGPTAYCASLCPTGAALSFFGRRRLVRLALGEPTACGQRCGLCANACWLQLDPSSGDPGPDCDLCTRCFASCPRTNLVVRFGRPTARGLAGLLLAVAASMPVGISADAGERKLTLLLGDERERGGATLAAEVIDLTGVKLGIDSPERLRGVEVSLHLARGERRLADERGLLPRREVYGGPLHVELLGADGVPKAERRFEAPNAPASTPRRTIYRWRSQADLGPGDRVRIGSVRGWIEDPTSFAIPRAGLAIPRVRFLGFAVAGALIFGGLLSLAYALPTHRASTQETRDA